ncbi:hypothetical protein Tco_0036549 [Tanacetum coccineum]
MEITKVKTFNPSAVWDYGKRVNHQNFSKNLKYPHAKRTFNPSAVLTRAGLVNTDRSNVSTTRSISTVRHVSTARPLASKIAQSNSVIRPYHPRLDIVRPKASNSPIKRSYFTQPVYRPKALKPDVKTFGVNNMTTVGTMAVVSKDYEDFNGGFAAFGSDPKGEDIDPTAHAKPSESSPKDNDIQDLEDVIDKE